MSKDYMEARSEMLGTRNWKQTSTLSPAQFNAEDDKLERLNTLRCLSRDVFLRLISNPEMVDAPAMALASRSVAMAECLLVMLERAEKGEKLEEEENMLDGKLFGLFRNMYYEKRQG